MLKNFFESISIKSMVNESFAQPKVLLTSIKKFIGCDVFFNQDILRWSIREICSPHPKKSVTKWLRMKNIFTDSKQIFTDLTSIKKFIGSVLFFCLFLVPLNTFGQEFVSVCDRSDFLRENYVKELQMHDPNGSCETAHLILRLIREISVLGEGEKIENLQDGDFSGLLGLERLIIRYTDITSLPEKIFQGLASLQALILNSNQIKSLPKEIFHNLSRLQALIISSNQLEEIPEGVFQELSRLEYLDLINNQIKEIPEGIFHNLSRLKGLFLSYNKIEELPIGSFQELSQLEYLDLVSNQLEEIPEGIFHNLSHLKGLFLSYNKIKEIPNGAFQDLSQLQYLDLINNRIEEIPVEALQGLSQLKYLVIDSSIQNIDEIKRFLGEDVIISHQPIHNIAEIMEVSN